VGLRERLRQLWRRGGEGAPTLAQLKAETPGLHRLFPQNPLYLAGLASALFARGYSSQGLEALQEAQLHGYGAAHAAALLARHHVTRGRLREALDTLASVLAGSEALAEAHEIAGAAYFNMKDIPAAYRHYREAVRLDPTNALVRGSFAGVLDHYSRFDDAIVEARRALRFDPRSAVALKNLSIASGALARLEQEEEVLQLARTYHPKDAELELQMGFYKLRAGDYAAGWPLYEARLRVESDLPKVRASTAQRPRWDGGPFPGKTLLVFGEQGFGDNIMVARFYPELKALGGNVVLEVRPALTGLLSRAPGLDAVLALNETREPPMPYDLWISSMSVPFALGVDPHAREAPARYLEPAAESVAYWRERTAPYRGRKIGIAWSGNPQHKNDHRRSIPIELVHRLVDTPGTTFFSLQLSPGWGPEQRKPSALVDFTEELLTFDDTAGLADCMDLVISVDTSVAHVGGALGKPTWILVPYLAEWRWGLGGERSAWYPSAVILRQSKPGDWRGLVARVRERLTEGR
jgi:tetratricopeptide (TPR) repeat protein